MDQIILLYWIVHIILTERLSTSWNILPIDFIIDYLEHCNTPAIIVDMDDIKLCVLSFSSYLKLIDNDIMLLEIPVGNYEQFLEREIIKIVNSTKHNPFQIPMSSEKLCGIAKHTFGNNFMLPCKKKWNQLILSFKSYETFKINRIFIKPYNKDVCEFNCQIKLLYDFMIQNYLLKLFLLSLDQNKIGLDLLAQKLKNNNIINEDILVIPIKEISHTGDLLRFIKKQLHDNTFPNTTGYQICLIIPEISKMPLISIKQVE